MPISRADLLGEQERDLELRFSLISQAIDEHLQKNAHRLKNNGHIVFNIQEGIPNELVEMVIRNYRAEGWTVTRKKWQPNTCPYLLFS